MCVLSLYQPCKVGGKPLLLSITVEELLELDPISSGEHGNAKAYLMTPGFKVQALDHSTASFSPSDSST